MAPTQQLIDCAKFNGRYNIDIASYWIIGISQDEIVLGIVTELIAG